MLNSRIMSFELSVARRVGFLARNRNSSVLMESSRESKVSVVRIGNLPWTIEWTEMKGRSLFSPLRQACPPMAAILVFSFRARLLSVMP